jgi:hypothetical protein
VICEQVTPATTLSAAHECDDFDLISCGELRVGMLAAGDHAAIQLHSQVFAVEAAVVQQLAHRLPSGQDDGLSIDHHGYGRGSGHSADLSGLVQEFL